MPTQMRGVTTSEHANATETQTRHRVKVHRLRVCRPPTCAESVTGQPAHVTEVRTWHHVDLCSTPRMSPIHKRTGKIRDRRSTTLPPAHVTVPQTVRCRISVRSSISSLHRRRFIRPLYDRTLRELHAAAISTESTPYISTWSCEFVHKHDILLVQ